MIMVFILAKSSFLPLRAYPFGFSFIISRQLESMDWEKQNLENGELKLENRQSLQILEFKLKGEKLDQIEQKDSLRLFFSPIFKKISRNSRFSN